MIFIRAPILLLLISLPPAGLAQGPAKTAGLDYDYNSLAIDAILNSAREGAKLPDIKERVTILLHAAQILPASRRDDAIRFLDLALSDLKDEPGDENKKLRRSDRGRLRDSILSVYARWDPERAQILLKEAQSESGSDKKELQQSIRGPNWIQGLTDSQAAADSTASLGLSVIDSDLEKASVLIAQSFSTGIFSTFASKAFEKLARDHNRTALDKLEQAMLPILLSRTSLDPFTVTSAANLMNYDPEMQANVKRGLVTFVIGSIENWAQMARGEDGGSGVDPAYLGTSFLMFSLTVRPPIARYVPEELLRLDLLLEKVSALVPEHDRSLAQSSRPERLTEPRDQLADIMRDPNVAQRDARLVHLLFELLRKRGNDPTNLDVAADVIAGLSDADYRAAFGDLITTTRINALVKGRNFIEARRLAASISSPETRAWALLALSDSAAKSDPVLGFELTSDALRVLESTSPTPEKVQLAMMAVVILAKKDQQRAFNALAAAARYANSSASRIPAPTKPPVAFGLDAVIGDAHVRLGVFPESLGDIEPSQSLASLALTDWFLSQQIANGVREPVLRLRLQVLFAEGVLAAPPKPILKAPAKTQSPHRPAS